MVLHVYFQGYLVGHTTLNASNNCTSIKFLKSNTFKYGFKYEIKSDKWLVRYTFFALIKKIRNSSVLLTVLLKSYAPQTKNI